MCVMEAAIAFTVATASSLVGLYGQNQKIKQENFAIRQNVANAINAENMAKTTRQDGIEEARRAKLKSILATGDINSRLAAGNIGLNSMTALNLAETEKLNGENDALTILNKSNRQADGYMDRAQSYYQNAQLTSMNAKSDFNSFLLDSGLKIGTSTLNAWKETDNFKQKFGGGNKNAKLL